MYPKHARIPNTQKTGTMVLKESGFHNQVEDEEAAKMFNNEADLYSSLLRHPDAFEYIIEYYGSFERQGRRFLLLEYANGGDLASFFETVPRIRTPADREGFWNNFMNILRAFKVLDYLTQTNDPSECQWLLKG